LIYSNKRFLIYLNASELKKLWFDGEQPYIKLSKTDGGYSVFEIKPEDKYYQESWPEINWNI